MGFYDNDHAIIELMRFIEITNREFIFEDATQRRFKFFYILNLSIGKTVL